MTRANLILEDGRTFRGRAFGATTTRTGEIVFHTAMTGYQEVLTDPSFAKQVVVMSASHIGNTGVNEQDEESEQVWPVGFVVRTLSRRPSNWRSQGALDPYLQQHGVPGVEGIDTRALVRHIRDRGAMRCALSTDTSDPEEVLRRLADCPPMSGQALALESMGRPRRLEPSGSGVRVTVVDCGMKRNITQSLVNLGARVRVVPCTASATAWSDDADLLLFSNGPGDPSALPCVVAKIQSLIGTIPMTGICLGHQLLALAVGASTYKLPFGHRGANQPVRDTTSGHVMITSQNHGFAVDEQSLSSTGAIVTHQHLGDGTVSGFRHPDAGLFGVQFHPEACPGPRDASSVFHQFLSMSARS